MSHELIKVCKEHGDSFSEGSGVWELVCPAEVFRGRLLSESIAWAEAHSKDLGYEPTMDLEFAADLREIITGRPHRKPVTSDRFASDVWYT
jgi:hypothetical protein